MLYEVITIAETYDQVMAQTLANQDHFNWDSIPSVEQLGQLRMAAMERFLADFPAGRQAGRYVAGALPDLPFALDQFDLALSSHFLFLYSDQLSAEFHLQALEEMVRVAREVRVFPLLTLAGQPSPHLDFVMARLADVITSYSIHYTKLYDMKVQKMPLGSE